MRALLVALALAAPVDWASVDTAVKLAAAETDAQLCQREAMVTEQDPGQLCAKRAAAVEKKKAEPPCPHPSRDPSQIRKFKKGWSAAHGGMPCPESCQTYVLRDGKYVPYLRCGACAADHCVPLACCGPDTPENLHWIDAKENRKKSDDCSITSCG